MAYEASCRKEATSDMSALKEARSTSMTAAWLGAAGGGGTTAATAATPLLAGGFVCPMRQRYTAYFWCTLKAAYSLVGMKTLAPSLTLVKNLLLMSSMTA